MVSYLVAFKVHASLLSLKAKVTKSIKIATTLLTHWNHKRASNIKKKKSKNSINYCNILYNSRSVKKVVLVLFLKWVTALLNKILRIIFNPIVKCLTVAYKVHRFEMIRLYLNIEDSFHFSLLFFFFVWNKHTKYAK